MIKLIWNGKNLLKYVISILILLFLVWLFVNLFIGLFKKSTSEKYNERSKNIIGLWKSCIHSDTCIYFNFINNDTIVMFTIEKNDTTSIHKYYYSFGFTVSTGGKRHIKTSVLLNTSLNIQYGSNNQLVYDIRYLDKDSMLLLNSQNQTELILKR